LTTVPFGCIKYIWPQVGVELTHVCCDRNGNILIGQHKPQGVSKALAA